MSEDEKHRVVLWRTIDCWYENENEIRDRLIEPLMGYFQTHDPRTKGFEITHNLMIFYLNSNDIFRGIVQAANDEAIYSVKCLQRVLIEINFKSLYIFVKHATEKSDRVLREYRDVGEVEMVDWARYMLPIAKPKEYKIPSRPETIKQIKANYEQFFKKVPDATGNPFSMGPMISFLMENFKDSFDDDGLRLLASVLPEYSSLSSFIHGGPAAFGEFAKYSDDAKRLSEFERIVGLSSAMLNGQRSNILLSAIVTDAAFKKLAHEINSMYQKAVEEVAQIKKESQTP